MRIVIAGGSGFLGTALVRHLTGAGHSVVVLTRGNDGVRWSPNGESGPWARELDGADAVVNLSGAGIADKRWTKARKDVLIRSRILSTKSLVAAVTAAAQKPRVFVHGSAEGYYGAFDEGPRLEEGAPPGEDFLARLCVAWEAEADPIARLGCRLVIVRTAVVLAREGGALAKMMLPFKFFAGGPLGSGRQYLSWIHVDDWTRLIAWTIETSGVSGPVNAASPGAVTNREFSAALGRAMHRPSWAPVPGFVLRIVVGEMAGDALLRGQYVVPAKAQALGFRFQYPTIDDALSDAVR